VAGGRPVLEQLVDVVDTIATGVLVVTRATNVDERREWRSWKGVSGVETPGLRVEKRYPASGKLVSLLG